MSPSAARPTFALTASSRLTPVVAGRVVHVSRLTAWNERTSGTPYYTVHMSTSRRKNSQKAGNLRLQAGKCWWRCSSRPPSGTALQQFVDPVTAFVGRSLREP